MKLIHTSDWHIGKVVNEFDRLPDQEAWLGAFYRLLQEEKPDAVLIAGDLYDRAIPPVSAVRLLDDALTHIVRDLEIPVLAISGNHDSAARLSFGTRFLQDSGMTLQTDLQPTLYSTVLSDRYGEVEFHLLPFIESVLLKQQLDLPSNSTLNEAFDVYMRQQIAQLDASRRHVLIAHGFFANLHAPIDSTVFSESETNVGTCDIIDAALLNDAFDYVALGHLHAPQQVAERVRYSGSMLKFSASEAAQTKSVTVVELGKKGTLTITPRALPVVRDLRRVEGTMEQLLGGQPTEDYVFITLHETDMVLSAAEKLRAVFPNLMGIRYAGERELITFTSPNLKERHPEDLFEEFYNSVSPLELTARQKQTVQTLIRETQGEVDA